MSEDFFIDIEGLEIFVQRAGNPGNIALVFIHGASLSSGIWSKQFADSRLADNFLLYAFDLPGHGQSGKAKSDIDYSLKKLGETVNEVIKYLALKEYVLVTLSIATNIVGEIVENLKGCKGIFMIGASLVGEKFGVDSLILTFPYMHLLSAEEASKEELKAYATYLFNPSEEDLEEFVANYEQTDPAFRNQIGRALLESEYSDEVENLKNSKLPLALVYGKEEAIVKPGYLQNAGLRLWRDKIHLLERAGHLANVDNPEDLNKLLASFAKEVALM